VKRILTVLVVALVMAAMLVVMAAPAFARHGGHPPNVGPFAGSSDNFKRHSNACENGGSPRCVGN
jgi:hypothetical protein